MYTSIHFFTHSLLHMSHTHKEHCPAPALMRHGVPKQVFLCDEYPRTGHAPDKLVHREIHGILVGQRRLITMTTKVTNGSMVATVTSQ